MSELLDLSLDEMTQSLRNGELTSRELTLATLDRIQEFDPRLHAFLTVTADLAVEQAEKADQLLAACRRDKTNPASPLLGIPTAVKDVLCVKDVRCTCGSRILENFRPVFHATVVERLMTAGVVIVGKTNTDEFAMGSSTENSAYGPTHNPWDIERAPGGSSGGSAAAVAASLAPLALGTDTGGSVRQPASFCGVTGIKPTYGRVSRYGLIAYGSSLDTVGTFGRSAADASKVFFEIAGYDPLDATSMDIPLVEVQLNQAPEKALRGLRIGIPDEFFISGIQPEVEASVLGAVRMLEEYGARAVKSACRTPNMPSRFTI